MTSLSDSQNNIFSDADATPPHVISTTTKLNIRSYRKESFGLPVTSVVRQTYGQLSEKKLPSIYNNSASLETMEQESTAGHKGLVEQLRMRIAALYKYIQVLHTSYSARMEELTNQHNDKSQKYLTLIHDMHTRHQQEVYYYCSVIAGFEEYRSQITAIEEKMNFINAGIEDILKESMYHSQRNQELQKELEQKDGVIHYREQLLYQKYNMLRDNADLLEGIDQELNTCRYKIMEYERAKEEFNRIKGDWQLFQKELIELIDTTCINLPENSDTSHSTQCEVGKVAKDRCQHCKIQNLGRKVNQTMARLT